MEAWLEHYLTQPDDEEVLKKFYMNVRPWGFWKPIYEKVKKEYPEFERNKNFKQDMLNVIVGIIWQLSLIIVPIYMVIGKKIYMIIGIAILIITTIFLKFKWWDRLEENFGDKKSKSNIEGKIIYLNKRKKDEFRRI